MKYIVILADGMADWPLKQLGDGTPMEAANKPHMNAYAGGGRVGLCQTVPAECSPGSDVANMSILGYPPQQFYSGRSSLEALCVNVPLQPGDVTLRVNLVTLSDEERFEDKTLVDYCGGEITTADARRLIEDLKTVMDDQQFELYPSVGFRNCLHWKAGRNDMEYAAAHDIMGQKVGDNLPTGDNTEVVVNYMKRAHEFLKSYPYNLEKIKNGGRPANGVWLWGPGTKPALTPFAERYGLKGGVISGVDLIRGLGKAAKMDVLQLHTALGDVTTDFLGKGQMAAAYLLGGGELIFVHIEAPDESSHQNKLDYKLAAIERIDSETIPAIVDALDAAGEDYRLLITPDHATPISIRTHSRDPIPFIIFDSRFHKTDRSVNHSEKYAKTQGLFFDDGPALFRAFLNPNFH